MLRENKTYGVADERDGVADVRVYEGVHDVDVPPVGRVDAAQQRARLAAPARKVVHEVVVRHALDRGLFHGRAVLFCAVRDERDDVDLRCRRIISQSE